MSEREEFERVWHWLKAGLEYEIGGLAYTKEEIWDAIASRKLFLFATAKSAAIASPQDYPRHRILLIWSVGGDLREILRVIKPDLEKFAKLIGCTHIVSNGRKEWKGTAQRHGYDEHAVIYSKEL